ncbi:MAG TPA: MbcA/ParS/Xre antitoxin family protein [Nevskiaceae bacterium]|nr:MbcA/ParS/Xre antitoxin family protein [Nevskiaceae bacterium]
MALVAPTPAIDPKRAGGAALRTFFRISEAWGLRPKEERVILGNPAPSTFFHWKKEKDGALSRDVLERISYVIGIYKALQILLPRAEAADAWVRKENTAPQFGGRSALDRMLSGNVSDLYVVRAYLDGQRGG